jgi:hypothetical protein
LTKNVRYTPVLLFSIFLFFNGEAQPDTTKKPVPVDSLVKLATPVQNQKAVDSVRRLHSPKKATFRSLVLPGWGQAYNKKYWKIPIVYGALGTATGFFISNLNWYKRFRFAFKVLSNRDTGSYDLVHPEIRYSVVTNPDPNYLIQNRDYFRRNVDYSVVAFILLWGLNVVDASVDAHLKSFDVSPDLSFGVRAGYSELGGTNGISLILAFK